MPLRGIPGACSLPNHYSVVALGQQLVNAAAAGSTVLVCPGTYAEQVEIAKSLTLTGMQSGNKDAVIITLPAGVSNNTVIDFGAQNGPFPTAAQLWVHDATGVTVTNLTVSGDQPNAVPANVCNLVGIYFKATTGNILSKNTILNAVAVSSTANTCP